MYLAGPLRATGSHAKRPRTLYPTRHGATRVGTGPSRLQAPLLHDPGLHSPGFQHSWLQPSRLQGSCFQGSRLHHPGLQPSWLQSSWLQPSGISPNCRGKTRQDVGESSDAGSMERAPYLLCLGVRRCRPWGRGDMPGRRPLPHGIVPPCPGVSCSTAQTPSCASCWGSGLHSDSLSVLFKATHYFMPPLSPRASIKGPRGSPISGRGSPMGPPLISWGGPRLSCPGIWCIGAPWWGGPR